MSLIAWTHAVETLSLWELNWLSRAIDSANPDSRPELAEQAWRPLCLSTIQAEYSFDKDSKPSRQRARRRALPAASDVKSA